MRRIRGSLSAEGIRIAFVVAWFNERVTKSLLEGGLEAFNRLGGRDADITVVEVPGSFELPLVCKKLAQQQDIDVVVALGAVIRGETAHFDFVAGQSVSGLMSSMLQANKPIIFGILTTDTPEQAEARAGGKAGNKGAEAVMTAVEMVRVLNEL